MLSFTTFVVVRRGGAVNLTTMTKNKTTAYVHDAAAIVPVRVRSGGRGGGDIVDAIVFRRPSRSHCATVGFTSGKNNKRYHTLSMRYRRMSAPPNSFARSLAVNVVLKREQNKKSRSVNRFVRLSALPLLFYTYSVFLRHVRGPFITGFAFVRFRR